MPFCLVKSKVRRILPDIVRETIKVMPVLSIKLTFAIYIQPELAGREVLAYLVQQHAAVDIGRCIAYSFHRLKILWNKFLPFAHMRKIFLLIFQEEITNHMSVLNLQLTMILITIFAIQNEFMYSHTDMLKGVVILHIVCYPAL